MNEARFLSLLEKLISESKYLQNNPAAGLVPKEDLASNHVLECLKPFTKENGGLLEINRITYAEGRGNIIIKYPGTSDKIVSFIGSHLDVVPANPDNGWDHDPFTLHIDGDNLWGRGTTDCLGHVALLTDLLATIAEKRIPLKTSIVVVFICNEENSVIPDIGIDQLEKDGHLNQLKHGPVFWVDSADSQPCIGTAGVIQWQIEVVGKVFHSGLPHNGINAIEFAMDIVSYLQEQFYKDFPRHPKEEEYNFITASTMKPTQFETAAGSINQLPGSCTVRGDIRICPFYDIADIRIAIEKYVQDINADPEIIQKNLHGPHSKYTLPAEDRKGKVTLTWITPGENGIACDIDSVGYIALRDATQLILGSVVPYSLGGSLPLVRDMQESGFDLQICGYGLSHKYHAENESASLSKLKAAVRILAKVLSTVEH